MSISGPADLVRHPAFEHALRSALGSKEAEGYIATDMPVAMENVLAMIAGFAAASGSLAGLRVHWTSTDKKTKVDYEALKALVNIMFEYGFNQGAEQAHETFPRPDGFKVPEVKDTGKLTGFGDALKAYRGGMN